MAQYPPPPEPDQQHYYPVPSATHQLVDRVQHDQMQFADLNQPIFAKDDADSEEHAANNHIHHLAHELQQQAAIEEQQRQQDRAQSQDAATAAAQDPSQKINRLRKACDSCSIRKVKCDEAGPPCRACSQLDIPCTFSRPTRRRGPPNKHAEAIKKRRLEGGSPSPSSPTHAAQALAALSSHPTGQTLSAESICPLDTLNLLIDDFFTSVHPLCPFPHEPSFREAWKRREDLNNTRFLALLASMIGALVASFPRKPRLHLKSQRRESMFPSHTSLVTRCQKICSVARGPGYLESDNLNVYDGATSYFLGLAAVYTFRWRQGRLYFGESLTIIRTLGLHLPEPHAQESLGKLPQSVGLHDYPQEEDGADPRADHRVDNITREMGRRVFWTIFVGIKSMQQLGTSFGEIVIPPPTAALPYPPLPAEVDDFCIYPTHNEPQPPGLIPIITGFNANVRVYNSYNSLTSIEMAWGIDPSLNWDRRAQLLYDALCRCKSTIKDLPPELLVDNFRPHGAAGGASSAPSISVQRDPASSLLPATERESVEQTPEERRQMQQEIQKANIYASCLATRTFLVERFWSLCEAHARSSSPTMEIKSVAGSNGRAAATGQPAIEAEMREERESIMRELLVVLNNIDQVNMEPNADSFTMKIRLIAGTLLDAPDGRKGQLAVQAQDYLAAFLRILVRLERAVPANSESSEHDDDETELRIWTDLREAQTKFAQQVGLLGPSRVVV